MTPEQIIGYLILALLLTVGAYALHRRRESWRDPDGTPLGVPSREDLAVMMHADLSYLDWLDLHDRDKAAARDAFYRSRGL